MGRKLTSGSRVQKQTRSPEPKIQNQIYKNMISEASPAQRCHRIHVRYVNEGGGPTNHEAAAGSHGHLQLGVLVLPLLLLQVRLGIVGIQLQGG